MEPFDHSVLQVKEAVVYVVKSHQLLNKGDISQAFLASKEALNSAGRLSNLCVYTSLITHLVSDCAML